VPDDCYAEAITEIPELLTDEIVCVAYPLHGDGSERDWESLYLGAFSDAGWRMIGGAGNQYWLAKPIDGSDCSDWINMTGWVLADREGIERIQTGDADFNDFEFGTFLFDQNEPICGERRFWLDH